MRRPAIQKQFYDIEERVIIRPAGSAVVELDEPTSKLQKGPAVTQTLEYPHAHGVYAHADVIADNAPVAPTIPVVAYAPVHVPVAPLVSHTTLSPLSFLSSTSAPNDLSINNVESESVVIENPDFRNGINRARLPQVYDGFAISRYDNISCRFIEEGSTVPSSSPIHIKINLFAII